nr:immunoglobulin heavy chain junction region [Macaca mulatta]MOW93310.1 immunoglobulin heavy chain junction region [Macaca mulatta]MOW93453.1 immunoglobulin heavy chain junction region [Macaca mulatta]MOW93528.1 immunoglobulin heavy chain junction region [Macaca mulatta]MOW93530.1 immunoglobulin heavy chain junction region [Macaca mulatta]
CAKDVDPTYYYGSGYYPSGLDSW